MINRFHGTESMSRDFCFTLELLSDDAAISLESLMGKLVCVSLVLSDGGLRPFSGYVSSFRFVRTDGGIVFYEAVLVPWLHYARLRQNNRLFMTKIMMSWYIRHTVFKSLRTMTSSLP